MWSVTFTLCDKTNAHASRSVPRIPYSNVPLALSRASPPFQQEHWKEEIDVALTITFAMDGLDESRPVALWAFSESGSVFD